MSTVGDELLEERRRRRRAGDPRLSDEGRVLFARMGAGDLVEELHVALEADVANDAFLGRPRGAADDIGISIHVLEPGRR